MEPTELSTTLQHFYVEARTLEKSQQSQQYESHSFRAGQIFIYIPSKKAVFRYSGWIIQASKHAQFWKLEKFLSLAGVYLVTWRI